MKKFLSLLLSFLIVFSLFAGCSKNSNPKKAVNNYFTSIKEGKDTDLTNRIKESLKNFDGSDPDKEVIDTFLDTLKKTEVTVTDYDKNGDTAVVNVNVKSVSLKDVMSNFSKEYLEDSFSNSPLSKDEQTEKNIEILINCMKNTEATERSGKINVTKSSKGWVVTDTDSDFSEAILGITESDLNTLRKTNNN